MPKNTLSKRGKKALHTELRADLEVFFNAANDLFDIETNPGGQFPVSMAENNLSWPGLRERIEQSISFKAMPKWVSNYTGMGGNEDFLEAVANFMSVHLTGCAIEPNRINTSAGATAVLELSSWILCGAGDVVAIPAPSYPVYSQDFGNKSALTRHDILTFENLERNDGLSNLTIKDLKKANAAINKSGKKLKLLVLTTPDNPTGCIYTQEQLSEISEWCIKKKIHLLINELYGLSMIHTNHPDIKEDYKEEITFTSFAQLMKKKKSDYLHMSYGLSKDLGISGLRVGVIHSYNEKFLKAYANLNAPHLVSNLTQWALTDVLSDRDFMSHYIIKNQARLTSNYALVIKFLKENKIPYLPARGSLFVWIDLSKYMRGNSKKSEHKLWQDLYEATGILLTPGTGFGHKKTGQFRFVVSFLQKEVLNEGLKKMADFLTLGK